MVSLGSTCVRVGEEAREGSRRLVVTTYVSDDEVDAGATRETCGVVDQLAEGGGLEKQDVGGEVIEVTKEQEVNTLLL